MKILSACCHVDTYIEGSEHATRFYVCESCGLACDPWDGEPTDDEIYNRYGMEGGIGYDTTDRRTEDDV